MGPRMRTPNTIERTEAKLDNELRNEDLELVVGGTNLVGQSLRVSVAVHGVPSNTSTSLKSSL
jgi:hypothetical protein